MASEILYNENLRQNLLAGANQLADTVRKTIGPTGCSVVLQRESLTPPMVMNDGAAIAKEISLPDDGENAAVQILKDCASQVSDTAGGGAVTTILLSEYMFREGIRNVAAGANPIELRKGMQGAAQLAGAAIRRISRPVDSKILMAHVAMTATGDDAIGAMVADAVEQAGTDGVITVEASHTAQTYLDVRAGMQFERGYLFPWMVTDSETMTAELTAPYVLVTDKTISDPHDLLPLLEQVSASGRPLLIIAEGIEGGAVNLLAQNARAGKIKVAAVNPPAYGNGRQARLEDLSILTGCAFVSDSMGLTLRETTVDMLGSASSVVVDRRNTSITGGAGDPESVAARVHMLRSMMEKAEYDFDREQLRERLAKLTCGAVTIYAGAATEIEFQERKQRIEAALRAVKGAMAEGVVAGGGIAYLRTIPAIEAYAKTLSGDRKTGTEIVRRALEIPTRQIAENVGTDGGPTVATIMRQPTGIGFNALTGEFVDMLNAGIIDSSRAARTAIEAAASAAAMLLTTEAAVLACP